jgi:hypothetical protein
MKTSATTFSLTGEAKETLALAPDRNKIFSSADMWNIQRRKRSRVQRRFFI